MDAQVQTEMMRWAAAAEAHQLADLTFAEVSRSLRALSSTYVERRTGLREGAALSGAGKRAAFALFYGPLHFLLIHHVVASLGAPLTTVEALLDLGCGTGSAGAGWATACGRRPRIAGVDRHPWAVDEARRTYAAFGLEGSTRIGDLTRVALPRETLRHSGSPVGRSARLQPDGSPNAATRPRAAGRTGVLLAFVVNEISDSAARSTLLSRLLASAEGGSRVLVVEPLAGFVAPWWREWQGAFEGVGGRADQWRFRADVPPIVEKLGRATRLDYLEVKGRSLMV